MLLTRLHLLLVHDLLALGLLGEIHLLSLPPVLLNWYVVLSNQFADGRRWEMVLFLNFAVQARNDTAAIVLVLLVGLID